MAADTESQLTKLIVLIAHGERKEQINFALSAMNKKGLPPAVTSALAEETLAFAGACMPSFSHPATFGQVLPACFLSVVEHCRSSYLFVAFVLCSLPHQQHTYLLRTTLV